MDTKVTTIDGFKVTLGEDEGQPNVWVEKGGCCSSLAHVHHCGQIENYDTGKAITVPESTNDNITAWAEDNGY